MLFFYDKYQRKIYQTVIFLSLPNVCRFIRKKNRSIKWTVSVFSSIVELKQNKVWMFLKGKIIHGIVRYESMNSWVILTQNVILIYCPFLFIQKLAFPSSISFPINTEGSKRTSTCIGHLYISTKTKQKKKDTTIWQKVCCPAIHQITLSSLWLQTVGKPVALVAKMEQ